MYGGWYVLEYNMLYTRVIRAGDIWPRCMMHSARCAPRAGAFGKGGRVYNYEDSH
jgi:hypothetical protein